MNNIGEFFTENFTVGTVTLQVWVWLSIAAVPAIAIVLVIVRCVGGKKRRQKRLEAIKIQAEKDASFAELPAKEANDASAGQANPRETTPKENQ